MPTEKSFSKISDILSLFFSKGANKFLWYSNAFLRVTKWSRTVPATRDQRSTSPQLLTAGIVLTTHKIVLGNRPWLLTGQELSVLKPRLGRGQNNYWFPWFDPVTKQTFAPPPPMLQPQQLVCRRGKAMTTYEQLFLSFQNIK